MRRTAARLVGAKVRYRGLNHVIVRASSTSKDKTPDAFERLNIQLPLDAHSIRSKYSTTSSQHQRLRNLLNSHRHDEAYEFYTQIKKSRLHITPTTFLLVMKSIRMGQSPNASKMAVSVYYDAMNYYVHSKKLVAPLTMEQCRELSFDLLSSFSTCSDYTQLFYLNILWENHIGQLPDTSRNLELSYHCAHLKVLIRSGQIERATEYLEGAMQTFPDKHRFVRSMPMERILRELGATSDCDEICRWLSVIESESIQPQLYSYLLNIGLERNHYGLVKSIYDNYVMKGFTNSGVTTEDFISSDFHNTNTVFNTLNDKIIYQILHTLSTNGDVDSTLTLIESHYLHKTAKGEKALTKDLCIKIIESYCYHSGFNWNDSEALPSKNDQDQRVKQVLDVLNGFMVKSAQDKSDPLTYKDITSAMSVRFWKYYTHDEHIQETITQRSIISDQIRQSEENEWDTMVLPRKQSNQNVHASSFGNMLANLDVLRDFTTTHIDYLMAKKDIQNGTITLFINCLLNHINLHQNFTATAQVLNQLHNKNSNFALEWLDTDSYEIMFNTLGQSSAGKLSSHHIFAFLKAHSIPISPICYRGLISTQLRGNIHNGLQAAIYHYLKDFGVVIQSPIHQILQELPLQDVNSNEKTVSMLEYISAQEPSTSIEEFWNQNQLAKTFADEPDGLEVYSRKYYREYDVRDSGYIKKVFQL